MEKNSEYVRAFKRFAEQVRECEDQEIVHSGYVSMANIEKATSRIGKHPEGENIATTLREYIIDSTESDLKSQKTLLDYADNALNFAKRISHEEGEIAR